jgi:hypothetical protein
MNLSIPANQDHELSNVPSAVEPYTPAGTDGDSIATSHANRPVIESDDAPDKWHRPNPAVLRYHDSVTCAHCGRPFVARRRWARFCGSACRQRSFQGGRSAA